MTVPVEKNQEITIDITSMGEAGEGIGKLDGFTVFVQDAIPGDRIKARLIKVKKAYAVGKLIQVIEPSEKRIEAPCPYAAKCGGCQIQHMGYEAQLEQKRIFVESAMTRIGKLDVQVEPVIGMDEPFRYRNKGQYPVGGSSKHPLIGFYRARSHDVIDMDTCLLQSEAADKVVSVIKEAITQHEWQIYDEKTKNGLIRHILIRSAYKTGDMMVVFVINGKQLPGMKYVIDDLLEEVPAIKSIILNENKSKGNRVLGFKNRTLGEMTKLRTILVS